MTPMDQLRYAMWRLELWNRDYGTYDDIDNDVFDGTLIAGTMPDGLWRKGDRYPKQSEVEKARGKVSPS